MGKPQKSEQGSLLERISQHYNTVPDYFISPKKGWRVMAAN